MKTTSLNFFGSFTLWLLAAPLASAAETSVIFGLPHTPLGGASVSIEYGNLVVTRGEEAWEDETAAGAPGEFGVTIELGEADSGVWGQLDTSGAFDEGGYTIGRVFGQVDGQPDQPIGSLRAAMLDWMNGLVEVRTDFSPLGAETVTCEVYSGTELIALVPHCSGPLFISTYSESSPQANPFHRLPDGSVAALIELSQPMYIVLDGTLIEHDWIELEGGTRVTGDRIIIRPEQVTAVVDFASRVDVLAGGAEHQITLMQERLGVFKRGHRALGEARLNALGGKLSIAHADPERAGDEIGVAVEVENARLFGMNVQPVDLATNGAGLVASAVGNHSGQGGEFLGYAGVGNRGGTLEVFGNFMYFGDGLQVAIYRQDCLVDVLPVPGYSATVVLGGTPRVAGFAASADTWPIPASLAIRLDRVTSMTLPGGRTTEGDQVRFRSMHPTQLDRLSFVSLTWSNVPAVTITDETGAGTVSAADYLPEVVVPAFLKRFTGAADGVAASWIRSSGRTNAQGREWVVVSDRDSEANVTTATYSLEEDGLYSHGFAEASLELRGAAGLRLLPPAITVGQTYFSLGRMSWRDTASGREYPVEASSAVTVSGFELLDLPGAFGGSILALRLETAIRWERSGAPGALTNRLSTVWLVEGVGVVQFAETNCLENGAVHWRYGQVADYALLTTVLRTQTANVGANVRFQAEVRASPSAGIVAWHKDGAEVADEAGQLVLLNLQAADAGIYAAVLGLRSGTNLLAMLSCDVAHLIVLPFSDTPPFWVASLSPANIEVRSTVVDSAGNVYLAGAFRNALIVGGQSLAISSGDTDVFLAKFDSSGRLVWVRKAGGINADRAQSVQVDATDVYLAGSFTGTANFGPFVLTVPVTTRPDPVFVAKLDAHGDWLWVVQNTGTCDAVCRGMAADPAGNLYVVGTFNNGTAVFGSSTLWNASRSYAMFLLKLNASGQFLWARQVGATTNQNGEIGSACPTVVGLEPAGGFFVGGYFADSSLALDSFTLNSGSLYQEAGFLARADATGRFVWATSLGANVQSAAMDPAGQLYVLGEFSGTLSLGAVRLSTRTSGAYDLYLAKLAPDGTFLWARHSPHPYSYDPVPLIVDPANHLYLASSLYRDTDLDGTLFQSTYHGGAVLSKLDAAGQVLWHKEITGNGIQPSAMANDPSGNVYLAGQFQTSVRLGETNLTASAANNVFLVQITGATAPFITQQPSSQTVPAGNAAVFAVTATGTAPLLYQWRKNGQVIPNAMDRTFTIAHVEPADAGVYSVVVKNGGGILPSDTAALDVVVPDGGTFRFAESNLSLAETNAWVVVTVQRTGSAAAAASVDFLVGGGTATAGEDYWATYSSVAFAPGETTRRTVVPIVDDLDAESSETIVLRLCNPSAGATVGQPDTAILTVTDSDPPAPPGIRVQPVSRAVNLGGTVQFSVLANGAPPLFYQWRHGGSDIPDATNRVLAVRDAKPADAGDYAVVVRNDAGIVVSLAVTLTVAPLPVILAPPVSQVVSYGEAITFAVVASSSFPSITYRWYYHEGISPVLVAQGPTYSLDPVHYCHAGIYSVTVSDPGGSVASEPFALEVSGPRLRILAVTSPEGTKTSPQLFWRVTDYHLETRERDVDEWYAVPDASSGMIVPATEPQRFYRLRRTVLVD